MDLCPESIFLTNSDFIRNSDGSVAINPEIKCCQLIDCGFGGDYLKTNEKYINLKQTELSVSEEHMYKTDLHYFANICYFSFVFESYHNCKSELDLPLYLGMNGLLRFVVKKQLKLLQDLDKKRVETFTEVIRHTYFSRFYKELI